MTLLNELKIFTTNRVHKGQMPFLTVLLTANGQLNHVSGFMILKKSIWLLFLPVKSACSSRRFLTFVSLPLHRSNCKTTQESQHSSSLNSHDRKIGCKAWPSWLKLHFTVNRFRKKHDNEFGFTLGGGLVPGNRVW